MKPFEMCCVLLSPLDMGPNNITLGKSRLDGTLEPAARGKFAGDFG